MNLGMCTFWTKFMKICKGYKILVKHLEMTNMIDMLDE